jgi:hypothetical protein
MFIIITQGNYNNNKLAPPNFSTWGGIKRHTGYAIPQRAAYFNWSLPLTDASSQMQLRRHHWHSLNPVQLGLS